MTLKRNNNDKNNHINEQYSNDYFNFISISRIVLLELYFKLIINEIIAIVFDILFMYIITNIFISLKKTFSSNLIFCFYFISLIIFILDHHGIGKTVIIISRNNCDASVTLLIFYVFFSAGLKDKIVKVQGCNEKPKYIILTFTGSGGLCFFRPIHTGSRAKTTIEIGNYLLTQLKNVSNEILQHGSCLGLSSAELGFTQQNLSKESLIQSDNTRTDAHTILAPCEAGGMASGSILCGIGTSEWYDEMLAFFHEAQYKKIIRGLANGVIDAMIGAPTNDERIRYGRCYVTGMAYAATGNNDAIARLLHLAVSDVPSDVQRAAVTNIGLVLCNPETLQKTVQLLPNSYNSYIQYGAVAVEVARATAGNGDAIKTLKTLLEDTVAHARQSRLVSLGKLLMNKNCIRSSNYIYRD